MHGDIVLGARFITYTDKKTGEERTACVLSLGSDDLGKDKRNFGLSTCEQFIYKSDYNDNYNRCEKLKEGDRILLLRDRKGYILSIEKVAQ